jgi:hypothetical protein
MLTSLIEITPAAYRRGANQMRQQLSVGEHFWRGNAGGHRNRRRAIDAADWLRHDLGVSKSLWGEACLAMGREPAAVALAIVSTKEAAHFRTSPGGYFHGMVAKAKAGELYLERTVWAMRRAAEPERYQRAGRGGDRDRRDGGRMW